MLSRYRMDAKITTHCQLPLLELNFLSLDLNATGLDVLLQRVNLVVELCLRLNLAGNPLRDFVSFASLSEM